MKKLTLAHFHVALSPAFVVAVLADDNLSRLRMEYQQASFAIMKELAEEFIWVMGQDKLDPITQAKIRDTDIIRTKDIMRGSISREIMAWCCAYANQGPQTSAKQAWGNFQHSVLPARVEMRSKDEIVFYNEIVFEYVYLAVYRHKYGMMPANLEGNVGYVVDKLLKVSVRFPEDLPHPDKIYVALSERAGFAVPKATAGMLSPNITHHLDAVFKWELKKAVGKLTGDSR